VLEHVPRCRVDPVAAQGEQITKCTCMPSLSTAVVLRLEIRHCSRFFFSAGDDDGPDRAMSPKSKETLVGTTQSHPYRPSIYGIQVTLRLTRSPLIPAGVAIRSSSQWGGKFAARMLGEADVYPFAG
jgi:hypothetical protein